MKYQIKDDFLDLTSLVSIKEMVFSYHFPWYIIPTVARPGSDDGFYLAHIVIENNQIFSSEMYKKITPIIEKLDVFTLKRVKVNYYPVTSEIVEHKYHTDYPTPHAAAIFYLNSNDGSTILEDGTRIKSVENRLLLFEGHIKHKSTSCTNDPIGRFNINFNFTNT